VSAARRRISRACAVLAVVALCVLPAGCGLRGDSGEGPDAEQQRTLRVARFQLSHAAAALLGHDREGFLQWFPTDGGSRASVDALAGLGEVYDTLSRLPWRGFTFDVEPLGRDGVYRVRGTGQLGDAGPPDRIAVVRYLRLASVADGAVVAADETPEDLRSRYLMALHDPLVLQRPGIIVLADRRARERAGKVLAAAARARPRRAPSRRARAPSGRRAR
jgi:hypothetical protein